MSCVELEDVPPISHDRVKDGSVGDYELMAVICFIRDPDSEEKNNLVSIIHVDQSYYERAGQPETKSNWLLFNDFWYVF